MDTPSAIKILVVDDREDNLMSIETILETFNYQIVKARSGVDALKILLHQNDFTLILMDVKMPGMSGIETAGMISQRDKLKHIPIIFITAFDKGEETILEGYQLGAVDFIYKPVDAQLLRYKVSVFVELFNRQNQLLEQDKLLRAANEKLRQEIAEREASERKVLELNKQLVKSNEALTATNEELDRFVYVASHDLQEPLRKIQTFSGLLMQDSVIVTHQEANMILSKIIHSATRMRDLIRGILAFSRNDDDAKSFELVDLNSIVRNVLTDLELEIAAQKALITVEPLPKVWGVPMQMSQLFQNLIHNSLKFKKVNSVPEVKIYESTTKSSPPVHQSANSTLTHYHQIYVEDNGIGFDMKHADNIFEVFKRLHTSSKYEGTGIGLSICKKIVDKHRGSIVAESQADQGARFIITLPEVDTEIAVD